MGSPAADDASRALPVYALPEPLAVASVSFEGARPTLNNTTVE